MWGPHVESCRVCSADVVREALPSPTLPTIRDLWEKWKDVAEHDMAPNTWKVAQSHLSIWSRTRIQLDDGWSGFVSEMPWDKMTARASELYRSIREKTPNGRTKKDGTPATICPTTVNREMTTLISLFNYHRDVRKSIAYNPAIGWDRVDEAPYARQTYLSDEKAKAFIESGKLAFQDVCTVALRCAGMRQSEARMLRKAEVDFDSKVINLPSTRNKNENARVVPFASDVEAILRRNCEISRGEYVFVAPADSTRTKPISPHTWQGWLKQARLRSGVVGFAGENVVTHTLRHKAVTDLLQDKVDPTAIMAAAAMSPQTLQRYAKFTPTQQENLRDHMESKLEPKAEAQPEVTRYAARRSVAARRGRVFR